MRKTTLTLAHLSITIYDLEDGWYKVCIYFTDYEVDPPEEMVDIGNGFKVSKGCLIKPLLILYNKKDELITGEKYHELIENTAKYVANSPLNEIILDSISAIRDAVIWESEW